MGTHLDDNWTGKLEDIDPKSIRIRPAPGETGVFTVHFAANDQESAFAYTGRAGPQNVSQISFWTGAAAPGALKAFQDLVHRCADGS